jgi:hypothetical protein
MRWIGRLLWSVELAGVVVVVVLAPLAAVYAFVTGEPGQGLVALGLSSPASGLATPSQAGMGPDCSLRA